MNYFRLVIISLVGALIVAGGFYLLQRGSPLQNPTARVSSPSTDVTTSAAERVASKADTSNQPVTQLDEIRFYLDKADFLKTQERLLTIDPPTQLSSYYLGLLSAYFCDRL